MDLNEKNAKLAELKNKRKNYFDEISKISDEIYNIEFLDDDIVGHCYVESYDAARGETPCHYMKVISIQKEHSKNCDERWYNTLYFNSLDTYASIDFDMEPKSDIFHTNQIEISEKQFQKALSETLINISEKLHSNLTI